MKNQTSLLSLFGLLIAFCVFAPISISAQDGTKQKLPSATEIFGNFINASGGRKAADKIKSRTVKGSAEVSGMNLTGTFEMTNKAPNKSLIILNLVGYGEVVNGFDGTIGWVKDPAQGLRVKGGAELERVRATSEFFADLEFDKTYPKAEVTGSEKNGNSDVYVVKADSGTTLYFDTQTGLLVRTDRVSLNPAADRSPARITYEDYRDVDGVKRAFTIRQSMHGSDLVFKVSEIKHNVEIDDARFAKPKQ